MALPTGGLELIDQQWLAFDFLGGIATICIFSEWGVTGKIFGLLLAYNQVLLVLVGRRWSCWGRRFTDEID
jgi:hypothetical protein